MHKKMMLGLLPALVLVLAVAPAARADAKAEAKRYFDAGVSLLKAENYEGAAASFEASLEAYPTKTALFNLANCYKALTRYDEALAALFRLRRDFAGKLGAEMEAETIAIEKEIRNLVGALKIEVDRPGAAVLVDGREVGASPLSKALLLAPGSHEVTARLEGVEFGVEKVRMLPGKEKVVRVTSKGGAAAAPTAGPDPAGPHPDPLPAGEGAGTGETEGASMSSMPSTSSIDSAPPSPGLHPAWFWGMLGATAVLGGVTIGIDAAIGKASDEMKTDDDLNRAEGMQAAGVTFVVLTGAAAVTTAVLAFFTDWGGEESPPSGGEGAETRESEGASIPSTTSIRQRPLPSAWVTDTAAGLGVMGRF